MWNSFPTIMNSTNGQAVKIKNSDISNYNTTPEEFNNNRLALQQGAKNINFGYYSCLGRETDNFLLYKNKYFFEII